MAQKNDDRRKCKKNQQGISDQVIRLVMTVTDHEFSGLSVSVLASWLNIDRYKLSRQFKRQTKMTLESFLFREKMARAAFLLITRKRIKVKDVSERIGYCNSDYFIKKFREYYGIVPGKYKTLKTAARDPFGGGVSQSERHGFTFKRIDR